MTVATYSFVQGTDMHIKIMKESGYEEALFGLGLSYGLTSDYETWDDMPFEEQDKIMKIAESLCNKDGGHNKFMEHIMLWLDITAPRYWWIQADTYRVSSKSSESTMHTILKGLITQANFEEEIDRNYLSVLNFYAGSKQLQQLKNALPEGFLQRRVWVMSYKTLRNVLMQRGTHKLSQWKQFYHYAINNAEHPELLKIKKG